MKKFLSIFVIVLMQTYVSSAKDYGQDAGWTRYFSPQKTFSINYPVKWPVVNIKNGVVFKIPDDTGQYPQVGKIFVVEKPYSIDESFEVFMRGYVRKLKSMGANVLEVREVNMTHKNRRAIYIKAKLIFSGEKFDQFSYVFIANNKKYELLSTLLQNIDDPYGYLKGAVDTMMKNIYIIE